MLRKIWAFIKRDFLIQASYRFNFILTWANVFGSILIFYFIAKLFETGTSPYLVQYGGQYFPFVFIGIALTGSLTMTLFSLSANIRTEQLTGTLEAVLATPIKFYTLIICMSIWNFILSSLSIIVYLLFGAYFFGIKMINIDFLSTIVIFVLTILSFTSLSILSASFIIFFKKGDPISLLIGLFSGFLGGAYFPTDIFPKYLYGLSQLLPITYSLRALRMALLKGYDFKMLSSDIFILLGFCIVLLPLSVFIFRFSIKKAKIYGSLAHY